MVLNRLLVREFRLSQRNWRTQRVREPRAAAANNDKRPLCPPKHNSNSNTKQQQQQPIDNSIKLANYSLLCLPAYLLFVAAFLAATAAAAAFATFDAVALAHFFIFLFFSTYLVSSAARRVDHPKRAEPRFGLVERAASKAPLSTSSIAPLLLLLELISVGKNSVPKTTTQNEILTTIIDCLLFRLRKLHVGYFSCLFQIYVNQCSP